MFQKPPHGVSGLETSFLRKVASWRPKRVNLLNETYRTFFREEASYQSCMVVAYRLDGLQKAESCLLLRQTHMVTKPNEHEDDSNNTLLIRGVAGEINDGALRPLGENMPITSAQYC